MKPPLPGGSGKGGRFRSGSRILTGKPTPPVPQFQDPDPDDIEGHRRLFWQLAGQGVVYRRGRQHVVIDGGRDG